MNNGSILQALQVPSAQQEKGKIKVVDCRLYPTLSLKNPTNQGHPETFIYISRKTLTPYYFQVVSFWKATTEVGWLFHPCTALEQDAVLSYYVWCLPNHPEGTQYLTIVFLPFPEHPTSPTIPLNALQSLSTQH